VTGEEAPGSIFLPELLTERCLLFPFQEGKVMRPKKGRKHVS
jgi:hypothetical protein